MADGQIMMQIFRQSEALEVSQETTAELLGEDAVTLVLWSLQMIRFVQFTLENIQKFSALFVSLGSGMDNLP